MPRKNSPSLKRQIDPKAEHLDHPLSRRFFIVAGYALLLRLILAPWFAHSVDMGTFISWGKHLADVGMANFYDNDYWCDYLPGYLYVLGSLGKVAGLWSSVPLHIFLFKLPNILADLATAYLIWRLLKPTPKNDKIWVAVLYLFNPAILINSSAWGQADSLHAFCLFSALFLLVRRHPEYSAVMFGFAAAVKLHAIVLLPLAAVYAITARMPWYRVINA